MAIIKVKGVTHAYNPAGLVPGGAKPVVAHAIQQAATGPAIHPLAHPVGPTIKVGGVTHSYNPAGFVRGGASPPVAQAIQTAATGPVLKTRAAVKRKAAAATAADPMQQIVNRYISSLLTPKQQQQQAQAGIDAQLKASLAAINTAYDTQAKTLQEQQARAHTYAMALGSLRDASGMQTEADYQNAAARVQGLGTGLTGTVAAAQQASADDAAQRIAAATGGLGQVKGLDVAGLQNVAQYTGVTVPATNLYEEAASQAAQARLSQDARAQKVENIASDWQQKIADAATTRVGKVADLQATRPSLYQTALSAAQTGNRSDLATIISALALQNTAAKTPSEIQKNVAQAGATTKKGTAAVTTAQTGAAKVIGVDKKGNLVGGFYFKPGTQQAAKIPSGWKLDDTDKTGHSIMPAGDFFWSGAGRTEPAKMPSGWRLWEGDKTRHTIVPATGDYYWTTPGFKSAMPVPKNMRLDPNDPTHHKIIVNKAAVAGGAKGSRPAWQNPDGSLDTAHYYRPHQGADPILIPKGYHIDTSVDPHKPIPDAKAPGTVKPPKPSDIKIYNTEVSAALKPPAKGAGSAYLKPDPKQTPLDKAANGTSYIPAISLAQARKQLLALYPANMQKLAQVIAYVNTALAGAGFK